MTKKIAILGGSGFVGSELCRRLTAEGHTIRVLSRKLATATATSDLPNLTLHHCPEYSASELARETQSCDVLINLIGILNEKGRDGSGFDAAHYAITQNALQACISNAIPRMLQLSALHADVDGPSHYLRSKGKAETFFNNCRDIDITIFKPSVIFGPGDSFLNRFADLLSFTPGVFPLACGNARFAPVYVGDVVTAMANSLEQIDSYGNSYELCGPNIYTLKQLVELTGKFSGHSRWVISLPPTLSKLQAMMLELVPGKPMSMDNFRSLSLDSVCGECTPCPTSLESIAPSYLKK